MTSMLPESDRLHAFGAAFSLLLLCAGADARAQDTVVPDIGAGGKFNVSIINEASQTVRFQLRPKAGTWTEYALEANEKSVYSCEDCGGDFEISIRTGETVVSYSIRTGNLYAIRPNDDRRIFDVYALQ